MVNIISILQIRCLRVSHRVFSSQSHFKLLTEEGPSSFCGIVLMDHMTFDLAFLLPCQKS